MTLAFALAVGVLFGAGTFLLLKHDLFRVVAGVILVSNAANLTIMASGSSRGDAPIDAPAGGEAVSDPLVQAMTVTAIVIGFAVAALLLAIVYRVYLAEHTVDIDDLTRAEVEREKAVEQEDRPA